MRKSRKTFLVIVAAFFLLLLQGVVCAEIISQGMSGERYLYNVNGVMLALSLGDKIDDCLVTEQGLKCGEQIKVEHVAQRDELGEILKLRIDLGKCKEDLENLEQNCHDRQVQNITEFTGALRKKNDEIEKLSKEVENLTSGMAVNKKILEMCQARVLASESMQAATDKEQRPVISTGPGKKEELRPKTGLKERKKKQIEKKVLPEGKYGGWIVLKQNWSNIRRKPHVRADIVAQGLRGDIFRAIRYSCNWYNIEVDDGTTGWISGEIVSFRGDTEGYAFPEGVKSVLVKARDSHIRAGAGTHHKSKAIGVKGSRFDVLEHTENWAKIGLKNGSAGWIHKSMVRVANK